MGVVREPLAVLLGLLAFACAAGAAWQAGIAWAAAAHRPLARVAAALALVLAAAGFTLGYFEVLSGIGDLVFTFDTPTTRVLFDVAAIGLPFAVLGLLLGITSTLHASDVPARAILPAIAAGYAVGWVLDPLKTLSGPRMDEVRARYAASPTRPSGGGSAFGAGQGAGLFENLGGGWPSGHGGGGGGHGDSGGSSDPGEAALVLLLIALVVLAIAGGAITAALVFQAARKKAKAQLAAATRLRSAYEVAASRY